MFYHYFLIDYVRKLYNFELTHEFDIRIYELLNISPGKKTANHYLLKTRIYLTRISLFLILTQLMILAYIFRYKVSEAIKKFFNSSDSPFNLAIVRITIFYISLSSFLHYDHSIINYTKLPRELIFPPVGYEHFIHIIPLDTNMVSYLSYLFILFCFFSLIGVFTRLSTFITLILGIYLFGIPNLFGKVNHTHHHLIWFTAILCVSRCSDVLSVDAIISSFKNKNSKTSLQPSKIYGLPIRFIWILFGVIYFFPGFWKIYNKGIDWIISDNLRNIMYSKWFSLNWVPVYRIDQYPYIIKTAALFTILFELTFIIFIFIPKIRYVVIFGGIIFHNMTSLFMKISFKTLQDCYIVFFDWFKIFNKIGQFVFTKKYTLIYNTGDNALRFVSIIKKLDLLGSLYYSELKDAESDIASDSINKLYNLCENNLYVIESSGNFFYGLSAYIRLTTRIPLLLIFLPIILIIYLINRIPLIRNYILKSNISTLNYPDTSLRFNYKPLYLIGSFLIFINITFGFLYILESWPFSSYPSFRHLKTKPTTITLSIHLEDNHGNVSEINVKSLKKYYSVARLKSTMKNVIKSKDTSKFDAIFDTYKKSHPDTGNIAKIYYYKDIYSTVPRDEGYELLSREVLYVNELK